MKNTIIKDAMIFVLLFGGHDSYTDYAGCRRCLGPGI